MRGCCKKSLTEAVLGETVISLSLLAVSWGPVNDELTAPTFATLAPAAMVWYVDWVKSEGGHKRGLLGPTQATPCL